MTAGDVQGLGLTFFTANMSVADQQEYAGSVSAFSASASWARDCTAFSRSAEAASKAGNAG